MGWWAPRAIAEGRAGYPALRASLCRQTLFAVLLVPLLLSGRPLAAAEGDDQSTRFFHIAAGPVDGSSFTVAGFLATALSSPPGARPCDRGGYCGVPGLIAVVDAVASPPDALAMLISGRADAALMSADVIHGSVVRSVATLFYRDFHLVVLSGSDIADPAGIKNKPVMLAGRTAESGRLARLLGERAAFIRKGKRDGVADMGDALTALAEGTTGTLLAVGTTPIPELVDFARGTPIRLIGVMPEMIGKKTAPPGYSSCVIAAGTYASVGDTETLCVATELVVRADAPAELVHDVTASLWNESTVRLLANGGPGAREIRRPQALSDLAVPLHPGAARYYQEIGMMPVSAD
jgi:hypothetical protein